MPLWHMAGPALLPCHGHGVPLVFSGLCHDTPLCPAVALGLPRLYRARAPVTSCLCCTWHVMPFCQVMARAWRATSITGPLERYAFAAHGTSCLLLLLLLLVTIPACPASHWSRAHGTSCLTAIPSHGHGVPLVFDGMRHDTFLCPAMARGMACVHSDKALAAMPWLEQDVPLVFNGIWHDKSYCPAIAVGMAGFYNAEARSTICLCATQHVMHYWHALERAWRATCIQWHEA